jgi:hypothetical protein
MSSTMLKMQWENGRDSHRSLGGPTRGPKQRVRPARLTEAASVDLHAAETENDLSNHDAARWCWPLTHRAGVLHTAEFEIALSMARLHVAKFRFER